MNEFALTKPLKNHDPVCGDLMTMAERELAAFVSAVTELFGPELAKISAEDWIHELVASNINDLPVNDLPASTRQWRQLSVQVAARLASRVNASSTAIAS